VTQARRTEIALVEETLRREWPRLVRLCARLSDDGQAAEDLAQETLVEAWRNLHKVMIRPGSRPGYRPSPTMSVAAGAGARKTTRTVSRRRQ